MHTNRRRSVTALFTLLSLDLLGIGSMVAVDFSHSNPTATSAVVKPGATPHPSAGPRWQHTGPATLLHSIVVDPDNAQRIFAAGVDGVLRSDDGGRGWHYQNRGLPTNDRSIWNMTLYDHGRQLAAACDDGHLYRSDTATVRWRQASPMLGSSSIFAVSSDPAHPPTLLVGATGGIWRTTDDGQHWQRVYASPSADVAAFTWVGTQQGTVYAGLLPGPGQIVRSGDAGRTWHSTAQGLDGQEGVMALTAIRSRSGTVLAGTMGHRIWRQHGDGASWQLSAAGLPPGSHGASLLTGPDGTIWTGTMGSGIYRSRDDGYSWAPFGPPLPGNASIVLALAVTNQQFLAGTAIGVYRLPLGAGG